MGSFDRERSCQLPRTAAMAVLSRSVNLSVGNKAIPPRMRELTLPAHAVDAFRYFDGAVLLMDQHRDLCVHNEMADV